MAAGRLPELAQALTTLGRVQGNVTVLARQMECEEAAVRGWLLRLRTLGEELPDTPVPDPQARLRSETERLRADFRRSASAAQQARRGAACAQGPDIHRDREAAKRDRGSKQADAEGREGAAPPRPGRGSALAPPELDQRILACGNPVVLAAWLQRAVVITRVEELLVG